MAEPYCEHFDCACPPFVTDGRVAYPEWREYVEVMGITPLEEATMKAVHLASQDIPEGYRQVSSFYEPDEPVEKVQAAFESGEKGVTGQPIADVLREEAENAELHRGDDVEYQRAQAVHNPWDYTCVRHIPGEASRDAAVCRVCHPL